MNRKMIEFKNSPKIIYLSIKHIVADG